MKKPLIVRAEAEADLTEAFQWYEQQVRGLGDQCNRGGHLDLLTFSACPGQQSTKTSQMWMTDYTFARKGRVQNSQGLKMH